MTVSTPDAALTDGIISELEYHSSDDTVASVDENGKILINGEGAANITVSYDGVVYGTIEASGTKKEDDPPSEPEKKDDDPQDSKTDPPQSPGSGKGTGTGEGDDGSGGGAGNTNGSGDNTGNDGGGKSQTGNGTAGSGGSTGTDRSGLSGTETGGTSSGQGTGLNTDAAGRSIRPTGGVASGQTSQQSAAAAERAGAAGDTGGGENEVTVPTERKVYEITPDQEALAAMADGTADRGMLKRALLGGLVAIGIGILAESWHYKNQTLWVRRMKRIYEKK